MYDTLESDGEPRLIWATLNLRSLQDIQGEMLNRHLKLRREVGVSSNDLGRAICSWMVLKQPV